MLLQKLLVTFMTKEDLHCLSSKATVSLSIKGYFNVGLRDFEFVSDVLQFPEKRVVFELSTSDKEVSISE